MNILQQFKQDYILIKKDVCAKENRNALKKAAIEFLGLLAAFSGTLIMFTYTISIIWAG